LTSILEEGQEKQEVKEDFREIFSFEVIRRELKSLEGMRETIQM
jgi:hypothetical protein